ncbi:hypothetical protein Lgra_1758 [Legionella gratiana]|uniref:Opacity protein and related surface antigens n=1 Tax=Legionella gratiana TaxID=45066 RepID=A0A378JH19_9GAMM|nr:hypothetical protein [Legionella gratiana]KTD10792.1 hypothetical protein Lgra_1758 [Legionella gratiana]STX43950.1 Opacity protein and related surface antigens [Legionella gratiana]
MKRNLFYPSITALLLVCPHTSFAKNAGHVQNSSMQSVFNAPKNWFISLGAGAQFPDLQTPMQVNNGSEFSTPYNYDQYSISKNNGAVIAASAGRRWQNDNVWFPSYSLSIFWQYFFKTQLEGQITQYSLPQFTNYDYKLDFTSNLLLISGKMNLCKHGIFSPYINGGIGSSFNKVSNYHETALTNVTPRINPGFRNANTSEFAYNIGAGVDVHFLPQFILSVGYIYQDLGPYSSGNGVETWSNQSLNPGSYHSNEILVSMTYLF